MLEPSSSPVRGASGRAARLRRRLAVAALALAVTVPVGIGQTSADAAAKKPARLPKVDVAAAAAQCAISFGLPAATDAAKAKDLMAGRADLGRYGWFRLAKNPTWRPVSTLDSSGRGHMHSLDYLLPLLREGVRTGNPAMVNRFYALLKDWVKDNPPGGPTRATAWGPPIYEGFRSLVLTCAAAGPRGSEPWLVKALVLHGKQLSDPRRYQGVNNTSLHQSMGLYALGATLHQRGWQTLARTRIDRLSARLVHTDGSDEEGAPGYDMSNYRWFREAITRLQRGGDSVPGHLAAVDAIPAFAAQGTRPDGRIEALGDTSPIGLNKVFLGTAAEYGMTKGASGTPPTATYGAYTGGYVFGRSGWGTGSRLLKNESFYSVRAGSARGIPHAHDDAGSVTFYSQGSPLLVDTGQWRYQYGSMRSFIISRAAHNVVVVTGAKRTRPGKPSWSSAQVGDLDVTTVTDKGYAGVTITRTVVYDRVEDVLLVWDRLTSKKSVKASQQWGVKPGRKVSVVGDAAHTSGAGADVSLLFTSGGAPLDVTSGDTSPLRGWNSTKYGQLSASPSLRATQTGRSLQWLTVIAPRAAGVPESAVSASSSVSGSQATVALTSVAGSAVVTLGSRTAARAALAPVTPRAIAAKAVVAAGSATSVRASGLAPTGPATLERRAAGAAAWETAATATASAAGTATFPVQADVSADYRVTSGGASSASRTILAAVAPSAPQSVVATAQAGAVTVMWVPPVSDGGAPITGYRVTVAGRTVDVAPGVTSATVSGVVPGTQPVAVTAANAVLRSSPTATQVPVAVWPRVTATAKVTAGSAVTVRLQGLLPGSVASLTVTPVKGAPSVRGVRVGAAGTATVKLTVKQTVSLTVTDAGVTSAPRTITAVPRRK